MRFAGVKDPSRKSDRQLLSPYYLLVGTDGRSLPHQLSALTGSMQPKEGGR
ncbi:hypothetical protein BH18ACT9_BH18ACT9_05430 [soil metagenome]